MFRHISNSHLQEATMYALQSDRSYCIQLFTYKFEVNIVQFICLVAFDFNLSPVQF